METDRTNDRHDEAHMHSSLFMQLHLKNYPAVYVLAANLVCRPLVMYIKQAVNLN
jgi:hypothetical protein